MLFQLVFTSKKFKDDEGYVLIDTLNNIIIEAERNLGTDSNIKHRLLQFYEMWYQIKVFTIIHGLQAVILSMIKWTSYYILNVSINFI